MYAIYFKDHSLYTYTNNILYIPFYLQNGLVTTMSKGTNHIWVDITNYSINANNGFEFDYIDPNTIDILYPTSPSELQIAIAIIQEALKSLTATEITNALNGNPDEQATKILLTDQSYINAYKYVTGKDLNTANIGITTGSGLTSSKFFIPVLIVSGLIIFGKNQ